MEPDRQEQIVVTIRPGLHITQTCFRVGTRHFELEALRYLHTRQSAHDPLTRNSAIIGGAGMIGLLALGRFMHPAGVVAAATVFCGLLVVSAISARLRPRRQELWATYHGHQMPIFASDDAWLFGAVERQVRRSAAEVRNGKRQMPPGPALSEIPHPSQMHPSTMRTAF